MPNPPPFIIHTPRNCPPYINPDGGNGKYIGDVTLKWQTAGTSKFRLRFYDAPGGSEIAWPFDGSPPPWPVDECTASWNTGQLASFKYDVIIDEDETKKIDPMLVFDRVQRRKPGPNLYVVATLAAVIGFVIGWIAS